MVRGEDDPEREEEDGRGDMKVGKSKEGRGGKSRILKKK